MRTTLALSLLLVSAGSCAPTAELTALRADQQKILARLDALELSTAKMAKRIPKPEGPDPDAVYAVPVEGSAVRGHADAWVTIVEFSDFQCPFCARAQPTLAKILETYGKDVRLVFEHNPLPFHPEALPAAITAECAGAQGKFWDMHDLLFENQGDLGDDAYAGWARKIGADVKKWKACVEDKSVEVNIDRDMKHAASVGSRGTPSFFINGRSLVGAQPFERFKVLIDEELAKAKAAGLPAADYYRKAVIEKGVKPAG